MLRCRSLGQAPATAAMPVSVTLRHPAKSSACACTSQDREVSDLGTKGVDGPWIMHLLPLGACSRNTFCMQAWLPMPSAMRAAGCIAGDMLAASIVHYLMQILVDM